MGYIKQTVSASVDEYEKLKEIAETVEYEQISKIIENRKSTPISEYVSFDNAMKQAELK